MKTELYAQELIDVKVEPQSVEFNLYAAQQSIKNIKTLVFINKLDQYKGSRVDTSRLEFYDKAGNKTKSYSFSAGRRTGELNFQTLYNNKVWQWQSTSFNDKNRVSVSQSIRDAKGKDLMYHNRDIMNGDTMSFGDAIFTYNASGQLIKRDDFRNGKLVLRKTFEYKGTDMVLAQVRSNFDPQDFHQEYRYTYNSDHLPVEKSYSLIRYGKPDPAQVTYFTYKGKNLVNERYPDYSVAGKYIAVDYTYDAQNRLSEAMAKQDTLYRHITYQYEGNKLVKINAETNYWLKFTKELNIPDANSRTPLPMKFERAYTYDSHGHIATITEKLNGELKTERYYSIAYYE
ncbi:hypothetical protein [Mucilaginibacter pedocola]|uniref:Sugar-binding protein n=1 Tax=Mucilaginibacter pedocola TaxID=1792845 RepID=A0A1S9PIB9_9SPHI|nr:hypothetical protein [Mucilaginibacter pedocola]OOQ60705.1 hypothetical protein BC343_24235 [Mucilaginibacter pedocola]